jgi:membrane protein required for colicin V production
MALTGLDYVLLGLLAVSVLIGALRGVVREAMSLVVWIAAAWAASRYGSALAPQLADTIDNPQLRLWAARGLLLVGVLIAGGIITALIAMTLRAVGLGPTDRAIGMVFGLVRGVLLVALAVIVLRLAGFTDEPWWRESKLIPYAAPVAEALREVVAQVSGRSLPGDPAPPARAERPGVRS